VRQLLWAGSIVVVLVVLILIGYTYKWTGFGRAEVKETVQPAKTLWDWLDLLIVPIVLAIGGYLFTRSESVRSQRRAAEQAQVDREIANRRSKDEALEAYIDDMSELLIDHGLRSIPIYKPWEPMLERERRAGTLQSTEAGSQSNQAEPSPEEALREVARARTFTILQRLDADHKRTVVRFLYESGLIYNDSPIIPLEDADLSGADLRFADLKAIDLHQANLQFARLNGAHLEGANLSNAHLEGAHLGGSWLIGADLIGAQLQGASLLSADLQGADLTTADLGPADLSKGEKAGLYRFSLNLSEEDLHVSGANLLLATITEEQLDQCKDLEGATMPNGQKYEDWLKSREGDGG
jgi:uncharacterized protein YjbI with pentapeptide repeats